MMTRSYCYPIVIEHDAHILRMNALNNKRKHTCLMSGSPDHGNPGDLLKFFGSINKQSIFMFCNIFLAEVGYKIKSRPESNYVSDIWSSSLIFIRKLVISGILETYLFDHFATTHINRHRFENIFFTIKNANTGWTIYLMCRKTKEIAIQILDIDIEMYT